VLGWWNDKTEESNLKIGHDALGGSREWCQKILSLTHNPSHLIIACYAIGPPKVATM
jgi:hypothetical protein